jgi:hypothetical protein
LDFGICCRISAQILIQRGIARLLIQPHFCLFLPVFV